MLSTVRHHRRSRATVLFATVILALAMVAGPATAGAAELVTNYKLLSVGFLGNAQGQVIIVGGQLPDGTALPAVVELGVPQGATVDWMGELAGGESNEADIAADYKLDRTENGYDIYTATITKFPNFQIEATIPSVFVADATGAMAANVKYVSTNNAAEVHIGAEVPTGYSPVNAAMLTSFGGGLNGTVWGNSSTNYVAGTELTLAVSYAAAPAAAGGGAATGSSGTVWLVVALMVTALFGGLIFFFTIRRMGTEYRGK